MAGRKKGGSKTGGRTAGVPNRTTKEQKEFLNAILLKRGDSINKALDTLKSEPAKYLDAIAKLLPFVIAKKTDITTADEPIKQDLHITVDTSETAETLKKLRNGG